MIFACGVGRSFVADIRTGADGGDFGIGDQGFGRIGYAARERSICGLGMETCRKERHHKHNDALSTGHILKTFPWKLNCMEATPYFGVRSTLDRGVETYQMRDASYSKEVIY